MYYKIIGLGLGLVYSVVDQIPSILILIYAHSVNCQALRFDYLSDGIVAQATWSGAQRQRGRPRLQAWSA